MATSEQTAHAGTGHTVAGRTRGRSRSSPFAETAPVVAVGLAYAVAALVWVLAGPALPGGRWLAVHLFTLGVLTNLVLGFSEHFARTVTRLPAEPWVWQPVTANAAVIAVLAGLPTGTRWAVAAGATVLVAVVTTSYVRLRRMRGRALAPRFGWVVRVYERAHGAFVHGAVLGLLLGVGWLPGGWYGSGRLAHLHVNVLGWGGLTLLATLVLFGPTMVRARIEDGADARARGALRHGATGLTVGVLALLATGVGGDAATALRLVAAGALGVYAWAVGVVCAPVLRVAVRAGRDTASRLPLAALATWFVAVAWVDVAIVATGRLRLLDAAGLAVLVGVLAQAMVAALAYVAPLLRGSTLPAREGLSARLRWVGRPAAPAFNLGAALVVAAAVAGPGAGGGGALAARVGWVLVAAAVATHLVAGLLPLRRAPSQGR